MNVSTVSTTAGSFSTASTSYVDVTGASITLSTAGTYLILASAETYSSMSQYDGAIALTDGTTYFNASVPYGAYFGPWFAQIQVIISSTKTYKIQIKSTTGNTTYIRNEAISAIRLQ